MAKAPEDHLSPQEERFDAELAREELLADLPDVRPPHKLRVRQQNSVIALAFELDELLDKHRDPDYTKMTLPELHALCLERGIVIDDNATVEQLAELLAPVDYSAKPKSELFALATERGLEVNGKTSKDDLVDALYRSDPRSAAENRALIEMLDAAARIDEWAEETIAINVEEYTAWSEGRSHETFFALLTKYAASLGK